MDMRNGGDMAELTNDLYEFVGRTMHETILDGEWDKMPDTVKKTWHKRAQVVISVVYGSAIAQIRMKYPGGNTSPEEIRTDHIIKLLQGIREN